MISHSSRRDSGSTPTVGSSSSRSSGERTSVQARPSFCFIPPESRPASRLCERPQRRHLHEPRIALLPLLDADAVHVGVEIEIFQDAQILVQAEFLRHVADAVLDLLRVGADIDAQDFQLAAVGCHQAGDQAEKRRLARAIRSDQRRERAPGNVQRDAVQGVHDFSVSRRNILRISCPTTRPASCVSSCLSAAMTR